MAIDTSEQYTPGWWLDRLYQKLKGTRSAHQKLMDRYEGKGPSPALSSSLPKAAETFYRKTRLNMAELVVGSMLERMRVRAIRTSVSSEASDEAAWTMYRANDLDVSFPDALEHALVMGVSYLITGIRPGTPVDRDLTVDDIRLTWEDPRQMVSIQHAEDQSVVRAAARFLHDSEAGLDVAYLWIAGRLWRATAPRTTNRKMVYFNPSEWEWDDPDGLALPGDVRVPVVRLRNRRGVGEFERHTDLLDRIDHMILQRMVIATMQAFRQRAIKGDLPETYPDNHPQAGQKIDYDELFESDPGAMWLLPASTEIWESGQVDLSGILNAVKDDVRNLAAVTRRPLNVLSPEGANQSAEGAALTREGLTFATEDREMRFGRDLARAIAYGFRMMGDEQRGDLTNLSVEWMPVERWPLTTKASSAQQAKAAGMSKRWILENCWQATPEQIQREMSAALDDFMMGVDPNAAAALAASAPAPVPTPAGDPAPQ
ncbi:phage portal protein [Kocuria rosea]|uniref:phage portal protein n=1 Tax=Kocuria rosea TaxID=1275 RepID=UPI003D32E1EF